MTSKRYERKVYVLAKSGEIGPISVEDVAVLCGNGKIKASDQVRTAFGAHLGTVDDLMQGRVSVSSDRVQARGAPEDAPVSRNRTVPAIIAIAALLMTVVGGLLWISLRSNGNAERLPPQGQPTLATLSVEILRGPEAILRVELDQPAKEAVHMELTIDGDRARARLLSPASVVSIPKGERQTKVAVRRATTDPRPVRTRVRLEPNPHVGLGDFTSVDVVLVEEYPPSVAWDSFANDLDPSITAGWMGSRWGPAALRFAPQLMPDIDPSRQGFVLGYADLVAPEGGKVASERLLAKPYSRGRLWISCVIQGLPRKDGELPWSAFQLLFNDRARITVGLQKTARNQSWHFLDFRGSNQERVSQQFARDLTPARLVILCDLGEHAASSSCWFDPPMDREPAPKDGLHLSQLPPLSIHGISLVTQNGATLRIGDLRLGARWQEVMSAP